MPRTITFHRTYSPWQNENRSVSLCDAQPYAHTCCLPLHRGCTYTLQSPRDAKVLSKAGSSCRTWDNWEISLPSLSCLWLYRSFHESLSILKEKIRKKEWKICAHLFGLCWTLFKKGCLSRPEGIASDILSLTLDEYFFNSQWERVPVRNILSNTMCWCRKYAT